MTNIGELSSDEDDGDKSALRQSDSSSSEDEDTGVFVSRSKAGISGFSGADNMAYLEIDRTSAFGRELAAREGARGRRRQRKFF